MLVYGRRRIGKSYLLQHFTAGKRVVFYQATQGAEAVELKSFTQSVRSAIGSEQLPPGYAFPSWETALDFLAGRSEESPLVVILDEFPYLADTSPALPSEIQRWWDRNGRSRPLMLVLCGSALTFMERLERADAPLHGRFTRRIRVDALNYLEAAQFVPSLSPEDKARVYGILGGTPLYLEQWREDKTLEENLLRLFADPTSGLVDSAELVLTTDMPDSRAAYRIIQAIGLGKTRFSEIRDYANVASERILQRLVALRLVERRIPITDDPARSKRSIYRLEDPYFRFFFRFISRNRGEIDRGLGASVVANQVVPMLDDYMGFIFEDIAREYVRALTASGSAAWKADRIGQWWSTDGQHEIDVVGTTNLNHVTVAGSVKWRKHPLDRAVLKDLEQDLASLGANDDIQKLLIGRNGLDRALHGTPNVTGVSIADLYEPSTRARDDRD